MKSVSGLMSEYFHDPKPLLESVNVPISASKSEWNVLDGPERMKRTFKLKKTEALFFFIEEILQFQERLGHHAKITIEANEVTIEVFTHGMQRVTDLDQEYAKEADLIFADASEI